MNRELFVTATPHETKVGLVEDDQLAEIYLELENEYTLAGSYTKAVSPACFQECSPRLWTSGWSATPSFTSPTLWSWKTAKTWTTCLPAVLSSRNQDCSLVRQKAKLRPQTSGKRLPKAMDIH